MPRSALSELEGVVLGIVQGAQPCTAYRIRMTLRDSPSSFWSGSAGSIYPLLDRLTALKLVRARSDPEDRRGRQLVSLTPRGQRAHREWMLEAASNEVAAAVSDPIRSRAFFLSALNPADKERFLGDSLESLTAYLETTRADLETREEAADPYAYWAAVGAVYQAEARVEWMTQIKDRFSQERSSVVAKSGKAIESSGEVT